MNDKLKQWLEEMEQPENEKDFRDWAYGRGIMDRQISDQDKKAGFTARRPNPSLQGYEFKNKIKESYLAGYFSVDSNREIIEGAQGKEVEKKEEIKLSVNLSLIPRET